MIAVRVVAFAAGLTVVVATFSSSVRTVILPRGVHAKLTRLVFLVVRALFRVRIGPRASYEKQDRIMALYAPLALLALLVTWLTLIFLGYAAMFWALDGPSWERAFSLSGSAVLTLGFEPPVGTPATVLVLTEGALGLIELALLITHLPTLYAAFSRRESLVALLEVRAGNPPSGVEMLERFWQLGRLERLTDEVWQQWEVWFADVEETHTSFPALVFFRSPQPHHSWVTSAGAVLDAAALANSTVEMEHDVQADLCIRAGSLALRRIADYFHIPYDPDPRPGDPIAITRSEHDEVCARLEKSGLPLRPDREQAWRDFAGWRVNYDTVLLGLAQLTVAPTAPWSSDRGIATWRPSLFRGVASPRRKRGRDWL